MNFRYRYCTSNNAPWQVMPAPNDDINHVPPGALAFNAFSRANKTLGLLMFPYCRNTSLLQQSFSAGSDNAP